MGTMLTVGIYGLRDISYTSNTRERGIEGENSRTRNQEMKGNERRQRKDDYRQATVC